jgi:hypothetical protein
MRADVFHHNPATGMAVSDPSIHSSFVCDARLPFGLVTVISSPFVDITSSPHLNISMVIAPLYGAALTILVINFSFLIATWVLIGVEVV